MRDTTIIDCIVDDTTTTVTTIAMVAIVTAVDADSDEQNANATIKKKKQSRGDRRAREAPRGRRSSSNNVKEDMGATRRASTQ
jgi:hypothetical protein